MADPTLEILFLKNKKQVLNYLINIKIKKNELDKYKYKIDEIDVNQQLLLLSSNNINDFKTKFLYLFDITCITNN